ncbi:MAG: helix-turn-helix domain-containing protein [Acinetobacter sp.]|jgi:DNA-binding helix-turn-helix protein|nr:helix-turn-helix domain-containing protein [Acinetobacter sp.]DAB01436.1 MAG TPA: hypothetical protein CPT96_04175 [Candidatus Gastranaerophilales bacterium HUM_10]DAB10636.1 MAG TPA: hypothetical protein CPT91_08985 [Candidatus Gastranaerophilales bacterium HUM_16]
MNKEEGERLLRVLGENTRRVREEQGLSLEKFAELCEISPERLKKIESGKVKRLNLIELLKAIYKLGLTTETILHDL